jgi:hypothetical protein
MKTKILLTALLAVFSLNITTVRAENCDSVINDAINYLQTKESGYNRYVNFEMSVIKAPAKFVSYANGSFEVGIVNLKPFLTKSLFGKDIKVLFSDRTWGGGFGGFGANPFDPKKADVQQISLFNSMANIVLTTGGNAKYDIPLQCSNGLLYGITPDPNGSSMLVFSLEKTKLPAPR